MGRLLDEDDVLRIIRTMPPENGLTAMIEQGIKQLQASQYAPIFCQYCKKYKTKDCAIDIWTTDVTIYRVKPNDYCSFAKRRE